MTPDHRDDHTDDRAELAGDLGPARGASSGAAEPVVLEGEWRVTQVRRADGSQVEFGAVVATVAFVRDPDTGAITRIAGRSGVNRFTGAVTVDGAALRPGAIAGTRMAGPPAAMAVESDVLRALGAVAAWRSGAGDGGAGDGGAGPDVVTLLDAGGAEVIRLERDGHDETGDGVSPARG